MEYALDSNTVAGEHVRWLNRELKVGDTVMVRLIQAEQADPPQRRYSAESPKTRLREVLTLELRDVRTRMRQLEKELKRARKPMSKARQ